MYWWWFAPCKVLLFRLCVPHFRGPLCASEAFTCYTCNHRACTAIKSSTGSKGCCCVSSMDFLAQSPDIFTIQNLFLAHSCTVCTQAMQAVNCTVQQVDQCYGMQSSILVPIYYYPYYSTTCWKFRSIAAQNWCQESSTPEWAITVCCASTYAFEQTIHPFQGDFHASTGKFVFVHVCGWNVGASNPLFAHRHDSWSSHFKSIHVPPKLQN